MSWYELQEPQRRWHEQPFGRLLGGIGSASPFPTDLGIRGSGSGDLSTETEIDLLERLMIAFERMKRELSTDIRVV
jgi:hypothetical protein